MDEFIGKVASALHHSGYLVETSPQIPGISAWLYARSPQRIRLGFARVEDHILFVDWENTVFGRLDQLREVYARFSRHVNQSFRTPHSLRLQIPNLALVAVSDRAFPGDAQAFARSTSLSPWYGGEVGQIILVDLSSQQITSLSSLGSGRYPRPGALPLGHAARLVRQACTAAFTQPVEQIDE